VPYRRGDDQENEIDELMFKTEGLTLGGSKT
jgi:hypothetical protein